MKLSGLLDEVKEKTAKASDTARSLAFAGIAIAWIFKQGDFPNLSVPQPIVVAVAFFAAALTADLLQYVLVAWLMKKIHREYEEKLEKPDDDPEFWLPLYPGRVGYACYAFKIFFVLLGYVFLLGFLTKILPF